MKRVAAFIAFSACFVAASALAIEPQIGRGAGTSTCGEFAEAYKQKPMIEVVFFSWAQGYMTSWNVNGVIEDHSKYVALNGWSDERQMSFIRSYCDTHPLQNYMLAVHDLMSAMRLSGAEIDATGKP